MDKDGNGIKIQRISTAEQIGNLFTIGRGLLKFFPLQDLLMGWSANLQTKVKNYGFKRESWKFPNHSQTLDEKQTVPHHGNLSRGQNAPGMPAVSSSEALHLVGVEKEADNDSNAVFTNCTHNIM